MTDRDPSLDMALRLMGSADPPGGTDDDARFAKRVLAALGQKKAKPDEIDAALAAPFPDDHRDATAASEDEPGEHDLVEEHDGAAYAAEEARGEDRGWEGAISRPPTSGATSALDGLKGLTRSAPHPSVRPDDIGAAKGEDSGLIDLRGMSQSGEKPIVKEIAANRELHELARTAPQSPSALKPPAMPSSPPATSTSAHTAPVSSQAVASSNVAAPKKPASKSRMGLWIGGGGLAAAAAAALFVVAHSTADRAPEPSPRSADVAAAKATSAAAASEAPVVASATAVASASAAPDLSAVPEPAPTDDVADKVALTPKKAMSGTGSNGYAPAPTGAKPTATGTAPTTVASASNTPSQKGGGSGSLDDVLGLNKPTVPTANVAVTPDLPDRPESGDIRIAVLSKQAAINACVAGLDAPSNIVVQFSPAGTVAAVSVSKGPAKGTGAESCIKSALAGAKVERSKMGGTGYAVASP